ncbi:MAG: hypothetical protein NUV53_01525 [Patescibacteria group bacterium]|nr:hypothetical protein [Patescibacteria group bacterium]
MYPKKNIVIWLKSSQKETFASSYYKSAAYNQLARMLATRHALFFAYDASSYRGNDIFAPAYEYANGAISPTPTQITANTIYNLGNIPQENFKTLHARITNTPVFKKFCASKWDMYHYMPEFFPITIFVTTEAEFRSAVKHIPTERVVFKPNKGTNGVGVHILEKNELYLNDEMRMDIAKGALVQEFIDTKNGIPSICESYHDVKIVTINGIIVLTHVRIPEPGSLIASYQRGATIRELSTHTLPQEILSLYTTVHKKITARFPNPMYSMDIGIGSSSRKKSGLPTRPLLFEMNGHTTFPWDEFECRDLFIENLVAHIENV